MEPSGAQSSVANYRQANFCVDSRGVPKRRRMEGEERDEKKLDPKRYLGAQQEGTYVETEVKIATNITSRQHESRVFFWKVTLSCDLNDSRGIMEAVTRSNDFEYVASKKVTPKPKECKIVAPKRTKQTFIVDDDDDDEHSSPPQLRERSTRKCALIRRTFPSDCSSDMEGSDLEATPLMGLGKRRRPGDDIPLPVKCQQQMISGNMREDEKLLLETSKGGLNLCRLESIENLCDGFYVKSMHSPSTSTIPEDQKMDTQPADTLRESEEAAMDALGYDLLRASPELMDTMGLQCEDTLPKSSHGELLLDRCVSSRLFLHNSKDLQSTRTSGYTTTGLTKSCSLMSLGSALECDGKELEADGSTPRQSALDLTKSSSMISLGSINFEVGEFINFESAPTASEDMNVDAAPTSNSPSPNEVHLQSA